MATVAASRCARIQSLVLLADTGRRIDHVFQSMLSASAAWLTTLRDAPVGCHTAAQLALPTSPGILLKNDAAVINNALLEFQHLATNLTEYTAALLSGRRSETSYFCSRGEVYNYLFLGKYPVCPL